LENQNSTQESDLQQPRGTSRGFDTNAVDDPQAPAYYSQRSIMIFSVVFSVIFGAALLIFNLKENKPKWLVALYAILYTVFMLSVLSNFERNTGITLAANALGAYFLITVFWNKYVGRATLYRKKSITKPLIISIIITVPLAALAIYSAMHPEL